MCLISLSRLIVIRLMATAPETVVTHQVKEVFLINVSQSE